jgi:hypothetical protein
MHVFLAEYCRLLVRALQNCPRSYESFFVSPFPFIRHNRLSARSHTPRIVQSPGLASSPHQIPTNTVTQ